MEDSEQHPVTRDGPLTLLNLLHGVTRLRERVQVLAVGVQHDVPKPIAPREPLDVLASLLPTVEGYVVGIASNGVRATLA